MPGGLHPPPEVFLSWKPNYANPEERGPGILILAAFLLGLVYLVVALRLYCRGIQAKSLGLDDALVTINLIFLTGLGICCCLGHSIYGGNRHVWDSPIPTIVKYRKLTFIVIQLYTTSNTLTKISILLFYRRITGVTLSRGFRYMIYVAITLVIAYWVAFTIALFAGCSPFDAFWNQINPFWSKEFTCVDEAKVIIAASIVSIIQDFMCCFMPVILFWELQISKRRKYALFAIFGVGFCVCITGILRSIFVQRLYTSTYDATWYSDRISAVTLLELDLAVVCASLPALTHFFKRAAESQGSILSKIRSKLSDPLDRSNFERTRSNSVPRDASDDELARVPIGTERHAIRVIEDVEMHGYFVSPAAQSNGRHTTQKSWLDGESSTYISSNGSM